MKRTFSIRTGAAPAPGRHPGGTAAGTASTAASAPPTGAGAPLIAAGTALIAVTYGLVRLAFGLLLPEMQSDLGFDAAVAGVISSGGSVAYVAGAVAGFAAAGRHPRVLIVVAGGTAGAGAAGMALAPAVGPLALAAVSSSIGAGLASPALVSILQRGLAPRHRPGGQAVVNAGTGPGLVAAGVLALALLPQWRLAWTVAALAAVAAAGAVLVLERGAVAARQGRPGRPARQAGGGGVAATGRRASVPPWPWFVAHRRPLVAALLAGAASAAVWNFGRTLLVDAGVPAEATVWAWVALGVGGTLVIATAPALARLAAPTAWALTTIVLAVATAALVVAPGGLLSALAACAAFGWGYTAATGALIAWTADVDADRAASGTALLFVVLVLGQAVGAVVVGGLVASAGYGTSFVLAAALALVAGLGVLATRSGPARAVSPRPREVAEIRAREQGSRRFPGV